MKFSEEKEEMFTALYLFFEIDRPKSHHSAFQLKARDAVLEKMAAEEPHLFCQ